MADWRSTPTISGFLALAAALALLSPGVTAVRADDPAAASSSVSVSDGPSCQAGTVVGADEALASIRRVQQLQAKQRAARPQGPPAPGEVVSLNGRGYNYGPAPLDMPSPRELSRGR